MGAENSHVANACDDEIWIFFESRKLYPSEILLEASMDGGINVSDKLEASLHVGSKITVVLKPDLRIQYIRVPSREVTNIKQQGDVYVTAIAKRSNKDELMCYNFLVPSDRSIIVIDNGLVKFAKYGALWKDEDGVYH